MNCETLDLLSVARAASRLCDTLDAKGIISERPTHRNLVALMKRLDRLTRLSKELELGGAFDEDIATARKRKWQTEALIRGGVFKA
jgi:hypothetical protein